MSAVAAHRRFWIGTGVAAAALLALTVGVPLLHRIARQPRSTTASMRRLHQIGLALLLYQQDHGGAFPDTLGDLAAAEHMPVDRLGFCPPDDDADDAGDPRWPYVYLGRGVRPTATDSRTVVAYEPPAYNGGRGTDVLFGDGHTEYVAAADLSAKLAAGSPATGPSSRPAAAGILRP